MIHTLRNEGPEDDGTNEASCKQIGRTADIFTLLPDNFGYHGDLKARPCLLDPLWTSVAGKLEAWSTPGAHLGTTKAQPLLSIWRL